MISVHCQLERTYNCLDEEPLGMPTGDYHDGIN